MLPILHLNGAKIAGPTVLARLPHAELESLLEGYGYKCWFVEGDDPELMHQQMAATLDEIIPAIKAIQTEARANGYKQRPLWPMIVLRSPKGWTGPKLLHGKRLEGTFRSHQVPLTARANTLTNCRCSKTGSAATSRKNSSTSAENFTRNLRKLRQKAQRV